MVSNRTASSVGGAVQTATHLNDSEGGQVSAPWHLESLLQDYEDMDFKELLAACPIDKIELIRTPDFPRVSEL